MVCKRFAKWAFLTEALLMVVTTACTNKFDTPKKRNELKEYLSNKKTAVVRYFKNLGKSKKELQLEQKKQYVKNTMENFGLEDFIESVELSKDYNIKKTVVSNKEKKLFFADKKDEYVIDITIPLNIGKVYRFNQKTGKHDLIKIMRVGTGGKYLQTPIGNWKITKKFKATTDYIAWSRKIRKNLTNYDNAFGFYLNAKINRKRNFHAYMIALHNFPDHPDGTELKKGDISGINPGIGECRSGGCVRLKKADAVYINSMIPVKTRVNISYDTTYITKNKIIVLDDIYRYNTNTPEKILAELSQKGERTDWIDDSLLEQAIKKPGAIEIASIKKQEPKFSLISTLNASEQAYNNSNLQGE